MPFDTTTPVKLEPSLANLSLVLRHRELWPDRFRWDYNCCTSCAMGLAAKLWSIRLGMRPATNVCRAIGAPVCELASIFYHLGWRLRKQRFEIRPEDVADQIDAYLAARRHEHNK